MANQGKGSIKLKFVRQNLATLNPFLIAHGAWAMGSEVFFYYRLIGTVSNNLVLYNLLITTKA